MNLFIWRLTFILFVLWRLIRRLMLILLIPLWLLFGFAVWITIGYIIYWLLLSGVDTLFHVDLEQRAKIFIQDWQGIVALIWFAAARAL